MRKLRLKYKLYSSLSKECFGHNHIRKRRINYHLLHQLVLLPSKTKNVDVIRK